MKKGKTEKDFDEEILDQINKREVANQALKKILENLNEEEKKVRFRKRK